MKKVFMCVLVFLYVVVIMKFFLSDYTINYNVGEFKVFEKALDDSLYLEIEYQDYVYNFMFYTGRKLTKKIVKSVEVEEVNGHVCLTPKIKNILSYTVCNNNQYLSSLESASGEVSIPSLEGDFAYNKTLSSEEYVLIWKYDGFYYMNGENYKSINIFNKDRYSNDLMFVIDKYLIFPKYDNNYLFSSFMVLDMTNGKYEEIKTKFDINYDSYVAGNIKNKVFIFDNKNERLYELNYKKGEVTLVGDDLNGYIKYVDGKKRSANLSEYVKDKITYFEEEKEYLKVDKNYFSYIENDKVKYKYFDSENIEIVDTYKNNIYFISEDNLLRYNENGIKLISRNFEFNFNKGNMVFVYSK